ncbi:MAG: GNAT family protein [Devosia sp.]
MTVDLSTWTPRQRPGRTPLAGRLCTLEPLDPARHTASQYVHHTTLDPDGLLWRHLPYGPFDTVEAYRAHMERQGASEDPMFFAVVDNDRGEAVGVASLMRINPEHGTVEVGHICFTPLLQRTPAATEMIRLFGGLVFDGLGYRRFEWKCNNANDASKRAAERFGFQPEGVFRQHMVVKDANRDTAWFAMLDEDWPQIRTAMDAWLDPHNFDDEGRQVRPLSAFRADATSP